MGPVASVPWATVHLNVVSDLQMLFSHPESTILTAIVLVWMAKPVPNTRTRTAPVVGEFVGVAEDRNLSLKVRDSERLPTTLPAVTTTSVLPITTAAGRLRMRVSDVHDVTSTAVKPSRATMLYP
eukprot:1198670-Rhodomonas_salina.1